MYFVSLLKWFIYINHADTSISLKILVSFLNERDELKFFTMSVDLLIYFYRSANFCFVYFEAIIILNG